MIEGFGVLPDMGPDRAPLHEITEFKSGPMPRAKFFRLSADFCKAQGFSKDLLAEVIALYACRRILPTLADIASYGRQRNSTSEVGMANQRLRHHPCRIDAQLHASTCKRA